MGDRPDHTGSVVIEGTVTSGLIELFNPPDRPDYTGSVVIESGTVSITGTVTITGNVNIMNSVLYIATSGGTNIIIDKLTQGAVFPRIPFSINICGDYTQAPYGYARTRSGYGFYLPRGMRGVLRRIDVKVRNTHASSAQNIVGRLSAFISGYRYEYSQTVSIPANTATEAYFWNVYWTPAFSFWQYDALFFFIDLPASGANIEVGFDNTTFLGATVLTDETPPTPPASWIFDDNPPAKGGGRNIVAKIEVQGSSIGDIPVSGTINAIAVPNTASSSASTSTSVPSGAETTLASVVGAGRILRIYVRGGNSAVEIRLYVDGVQLRLLQSDYSDRFDYFNALGYTTSRHFAFINMLFYTAGANPCGMEICLPIEFQKQFDLKVYQATGAAVACTGTVNYNLLK